MNTQRRKTFENFCLRCYHFDPSTGVCSEIHENVRSYYKKFITKCNGEFFKDDPNKIVEEVEELEDVEDYQEKISDLDRDLKDVYHFKTLLGYGKFISGLGWAIVLLSVIAILGGLVSGEDVGFAVAGGALIFIILGIGMVVTGQLISCFVSIEKNTRLTYEILKKENYKPNIS